MTPYQRTAAQTQDAGQPKSVLTFRNWNLISEVTDGMFGAKIPEGYERIALLEKPLKTICRRQSQQSERSFVETEVVGVGGVP